MKPSGNNMIAKKVCWYETLAILLIAAFALAGAGALNARLLRLRGDLRLTQAPPTENMPPAVAFTTVALGGFRGVLADVLWARAGALQDVPVRRAGGRLDDRAGQRPARWSPQRRAARPAGAERPARTHRLRAALTAERAEGLIVTAPSAAGPRRGPFSAAPASSAPCPSAPPPGSARWPRLR